jgi:hypothetical protein
VRKGRIPPVPRLQPESAPLRPAHGRSPDQPPARRVARDLISARHASSDDSTARAAAAACSHLYHRLARWIGPDGCHALFTRALTQARPDHPALEQIYLRAHSEPYLEGAAGSIAAHGDAPTADAIESVLTHVVELLRRVIGDEMTAKLIDPELPESERRDAAAGERREES